jgi:hypothetical protein
LCIINNAYAQQPAYFILGENQFKGVQIYDVIQDHELNYWFATNEGIYYYNYYTFEKIECEKAKSKSVFNFVINKEGTIYCHNLNHQIFEIKDKECNVFYELLNNEYTADINLSITEENQLIVGAEKIILLNKNGEAIKRHDIGKSYLGSPFTTANGSIIFHLSGTDTLLVYSKGHFNYQKILFTEGKTKNLGVFRFFTLNTIQYALDLNSKMLFEFNPKSFEAHRIPQSAIFERSESIRIYETTNELWVAGTLPGVTLFNNTLSTHNTDIIYKDYFISDIYKDKEGNILLSTFDKGIIVIPDLSVPDVIHSFENDPITSLYSDNELGLLLGTSKGKLLSYLNKEFKLLNNKGKRPIEGIYGHPQSNIIVFDDGHIRAYDKKTKTIYSIIEASLKDAVFVSPNIFYIGTNMGIIKIEYNNQNIFSASLLKGLEQRIYSIAYNPDEKRIYAATANGLISFELEKEPKTIKYNNENIYALDLYYSDGKIFISTSKNGLLIAIENNIVKNIIPVFADKTITLNKLIIYNNTIIGKASSGFFQFDLNGKIIQNIHSQFGFSSQRVIDFTFYNKQLWVSHSGGVQQINISQTKKLNTIPKIFINSVIVNDTLFANKSNPEFKSNQRKIQFNFSAPTLRNRESINYYYKLQGYDNNWNINEYENNTIVYNALSPGKYTLLVKVENQGVYSNTISYPFSIAHPFYLRWWFIVLCIFIFLVVVFTVYHMQLRSQHKKLKQINELNTSKLTAIQSQMNPHFIFNSLNSIQDLVLKGDIENSYSYITTFSNMVRRTLDYSEKDFIDFEQEIKLLELYLSLEKLRFKKELEYEINIINIENIMLPPLLIQPFIENSLVHGLLHKEGEKILKLTFELNEILICTIEDNGIGRKKAKAIKQRQGIEHESFSGKAIRHRFEILSEVLKGKFGFTYEDLYTSGNVSGTKVILHIPIKHKF